MKYTPTNNKQPDFLNDRVCIEDYFYSKQQKRGYTIKESNKMPDKNFIYTVQFDDGTRGQMPEPFHRANCINLGYEKTEKKRLIECRRK